MTSRLKELPSNSREGDVSFAGTRVHYHEAGEGPPLLLIHGWNGSSKVFGRIIGQLTSSYSCLAVELPGFGISEPFKNKPHTLKNYAEVVSETAQRLGYRDYGVLGHSMGSLIAMNLANQDEQVAYIIMEGIPHLQKHLRQAIQGAPELYVRAVFRSLYGSPKLSFLLELLNPEFLSLSARHRWERSQRLKNASFRAVVESLRDIASFNEELAHIPEKIPVLVLEGASPTPVGRLVSAGKYAWKTNVSVDKIDSSSHSVGVQNPNEAVAKILGFTKLLM